jgi:hypothetical protein
VDRQDQQVQLERLVQQVRLVQLVFVVLLVLRVYKVLLQQFLVLKVPLDQLVPRVSKV